MPISFGCTCGKSFRVADTLAGKRTRCPACSAPLTVPVPEPEPVEDEPVFEVVDEPAAKDDENGAYGVRSEPAPQPAAAEPPAPPRRKRPRRERPQKWESDLPKITISPAVAGGFAALVGGGVLMYLATQNGRAPVRGAVVAGFGLLAVVRGFFGAEED